MRNWLQHTRRSALFRPILTTASVGLLFVSLPPLATLSYDLSFLTRPRTAITNLVLIYINGETLEKLGSDHDVLSRTNHTRLLNRLKEDGARLVFYDVLFNATNQSAEADETLARAVTNHGSVVLVTADETVPEPGGVKEKLTPLIPALKAVPKIFGHARFTKDLEDIVRRIPGDFAGQPYAAWAAADAFAPERFHDADRNRERWLNYFGPPDSDALPAFYFHSVLSTNPPPPGTFRGKFVFVGYKLPPNKRANADSFRTPYSLFGQDDMPGVAIHATAFLNLLGDDWLRRVPIGWQWLAAVVWGASIAAMLHALSRSRRLLVPAAFLGAGLLSAVSLTGQWQTFWWWSWLGPVCGQTLTAFLYAWYRPKPNPYDAFISYRRTPDHATARLIHNGLREHHIRSFIDEKNLEAGDFDEQLLHRIEEATYLVLIVSPTSLLRCLNNDDWILKELSHAQMKQKTIIPVLVQGADITNPNHVPDLPPLRELKRYQCEVYSPNDFDGFLQRLIKLLRTRSRQ